MYHFALVLLVLSSMSGQGPASACRYSGCYTCTRHSDGGLFSRDQCGYCADTGQCTSSWFHSCPSGWKTKTRQCPCTLSPKPSACASVSDCATYCGSSKECTRTGWRDGTCRCEGLDGQLATICTGGHRRLLGQVCATFFRCGLGGNQMLMLSELDKCDAAPRLGLYSWGLRDGDQPLAMCDVVYSCSRSKKGSLFNSCRIYAAKPNILKTSKVSEDELMDQMVQEMVKM
jgi:hypothetical protein